MYNSTGGWDARVYIGVESGPTTGCGLAVFGRKSGSSDFHQRKSVASSLINQPTLNRHFYVLLWDLILKVPIITLPLNLRNTSLETGLGRKGHEGETGYTYLYTRQTNQLRKKLISSFLSRFVVNSRDWSYRGILSTRRFDYRAILVSLPIYIDAIEVLEVSVTCIL